MTSHVVHGHDRFYHFSRSRFCMWYGNDTLQQMDGRGWIAIATASCMQPGASPRSDEQCKINMTAFDSSLLISQPICLHARPAVDRSFNSEQKVTFLPERRRRNYRGHRKDNGKDQNNERVLSINLRVSKPCSGTTHQRHQSLAYDTRFYHSATEVLSEVMLPMNMRTRRAKNHRSKT